MSASPTVQCDVCGKRPTESEPIYVTSRGKRCLDHSEVMASRRMLIDVRKADLMTMTKPKVPKQLDAVADIVLAYRPKPKTKPARRRKRRAAKIAKGK